MRVLLIGATGNFGCKLARLLAKEVGIALIAGGRNKVALNDLANEIGCTVALMDRDKFGAADIKALAVDLVIDASGPFQQSGTHVIEACIAARAHYCDIADARDFVRNIVHFDDAAKLAGVAVICGASTTPALSDAVVSNLTKGWAHIDSVRVAVSPSNRQKRGRAVVAAILAGVGQRLKCFQLGAWRNATGWGESQRIQFPEVGQRWASLCDTPDLDLLVERHSPRVGATFYASLELPVMHLGLALLAMLVRIGLLRSVLPFGGLLSWLADRLERFGNDCGGMRVDVQGQGADGTARHSLWWLAAKGNIGPNIPILAALGIVRLLRDKRLLWRGAAPCVGFLSLASFEHDFTTLGIETCTEEFARPLPVFRSALGTQFDILPPENRAIHSPAASLILHGEGRANVGTNPVSRFIAWLFSFPNAPTAVPITVIIEQQKDGSENWHRIWPKEIMSSRMTRGNAGQVVEHFGLIAFTLSLSAHQEGLDMNLLKATFWGITLPRFVLPRISATERVHDGRHMFDVAVRMPIIGLLVHYQGSLTSAANCN